MAIASQLTSRPIKRAAQPEAPIEVLLDAWCTKFGDKTLTIPETVLRGEPHPQWLIEQMLRALSFRTCQGGVIDDTKKWLHPDFWITGIESFVEGDIRFYIRPKTEKEKNGDR